MRPVFLVVLVVGAALARDPFAEWVKEHKKEYKSATELALRRSIFDANYADMVEHNARFDAGEVSWHRKVTPYYDLTREEWADMRLTRRQFNGTENFENNFSAQDLEYLERINSLTNVPDEWTWVDKGCVTSVKDQGQCGSCSAFAATAMMESCFCEATGTLYDDFSEQFLVDCANGYEYHDQEGWWGNSGCDGGWTQAYLQYVVNWEEGYTQIEESYPYQASDHSCRPDSNGWYNDATLTGMFNQWYTAEADMKAHVYESVMGSSIDASWLGDYDYGVYDDHRCRNQIHNHNCMWDTNHDITVVGYGTENGKDYWLIKNSWGQWFGENGYVKIKRGTGHCGIGSLSYTRALCQAN